MDRDSILQTVIPYLESKGIFSRGRFGMWKYEVSNTDHSLMQGVELVNRLMLNGKKSVVKTSVSQSKRKSPEEME